MNDMFENKILVTNTMLVQSSRFFNDEYINLNLNDTDRLYNFFDFSSLVESIILYDQLTTLEGKIYDDLGNCALISQLEKNNIVSSSRIPLEIDKIQNRLVNLIGTDKIFNRIGKGILVKIPNMIPEIFPDDCDEWIEEGVDVKWNRKTFLQAVGMPKSNIHLLNADNIFEFYRSDKGFSHFISGTGDYERGAYVIRTLIYQIVATENNLIFYPDYPRIPFLKDLNEYSRNSLTKEIYTWFAEKFEAEAELFIRDKKPISLLIPPFTSILLSRCSSRNDIFLELMNLREEFSNLRQVLRELEENQLNCTNIKERIKLKAKVEKMFNAAAKKYKSSHIITLEESLKFADKATKPFYNPSDPSSYSASILLLPIEKIKDWYFRRPLNQFFNARKEFNKIEMYTELVKKVFDIEFTDSEIKSFNSSLNILNESFSKKIKN